MDTEEEGDTGKAECEYINQVLRQIFQDREKLPGKNSLFYSFSKKKKKKKCFYHQHL